MSATGTASSNRILRMSRSSGASACRARSSAICTRLTRESCSARSTLVSGGCEELSISLASLSGTSCREGARCETLAYNADKVVVDDDAMVDAKHFRSLLEAPAVARDEAFKQDRGRAEPLRFGRRPPFSPQAIAVVEKQTLNNDGQIGSQGASPFEPSEHLVLSLDKMQANLGAKIVGLRAIEPMPAADLCCHVIDDWKTGKEEGFIVRRRALRQRWCGAVPAGRDLRGSVLRRARPPREWRHPPKQPL